MCDSWRENLMFLIKQHDSDPSLCLRPAVQMSLIGKTITQNHSFVQNEIQYIYVGDSSSSVRLSKFICGEHRFELIAEEDSPHQIMCFAFANRIILW
jgi:UDP-N-acetylmuramoylalanine-D-glutamate ligase